VPCLHHITLTSHYDLHVRTCMVAACFNPRVYVYMVMTMRADGNNHGHEGCFTGLRTHSRTHLRQQQPAMCFLSSTRLSLHVQCMSARFSLRLCFFSKTVHSARLCPEAPQLVLDEFIACCCAVLAAVLCCTSLYLMLLCLLL